MIRHWLSIVERKQRGSFFTPPLIAKKIIQLTLDPLINNIFWKKITSILLDESSNKDKEFTKLLKTVFSLQFIDPAMGDGIFLIETIKYFQLLCYNLYEKIKNNDELLQTFSNYFSGNCYYQVSLIHPEDFYLEIDKITLIIIKNQIFGVDVDPIAVEMAKKNILKIFSDDKIRKMTKIVLNLNLKTGNALYSPSVLPDSIENTITLLNNDFNTLKKQRKDILSNDITKMQKSVTEIMNITEECKKRIWTQYKSLSTVLKEKLIPEDKSLPELREFIWELEFPEVFAKSKRGFDIIISNIPWEKWKLYLRELLGSTRLNDLEKRKKLDKMITKDKKLAKELQLNKNIYGYFSNYFSRYYKFQEGEKNLFKLFIERAYQLSCSGAKIALITPGGLLGQYNCKKLRSLLLEKINLEYIIELISGDDIFPEIEHGLSTLIVIASNTKNNGFFNMKMGIHSIDELLDLCIHDTIKITNSFVLSSPALIVPAIHNKEELLLTKKILSYPLLSSKSWGCKTSRGLDVTISRDLLTTSKTDYPVIEGRSVVRLGYDDSNPRYWVNSIDDYQKRVSFFNKTVIVWKNFSGNHRRRRMRVAIIKPNTCCFTNSLLCIYNFPKGSEYYLAGIMCSVVFEFRIRQVAYGLNINQFIIDSMPVPLFDENNEIHQLLSIKVKNFQKKGKEWAKEKGLAKSTKAKSLLEQKYFDQITEIDALAAIIYGLTKNELRTVLSVYKKLEDDYKSLTLKYYSKYRKY